MEKLIGTAEAARVLQVADSKVARRILLKEGVRLQRLRRGELYADRSEVEALAAQRGGRRGPGRPPRKVEA